MRIDSHQHFWIYDSVRDAWITDDMKVIQRSFLPSDLQPLLQANGVDGCIAVQADQSENETNFLLQLAAENDFIKAVVGWIDFRAENLEERLKHFSKFKKLKGFRHILQGESDVAFMLREDFCKGISKLQQYGFTYDILIDPRHLANTLPFVERFPQQAFVIDHLAKPLIAQGEINEWKTAMAAIAKHSNVYCKLSGMVTEANWKQWKYEDFVPYLDAMVELFGTDRLMFGTDWPVCLLAGSYEQVCGILEQYLSSFTPTEQENIWYNNAARFYRL